MYTISSLNRPRTVACETTVGDISRSQIVFFWRVAKTFNSCLRQTIDLCQGRCFSLQFATVKTVKPSTCNRFSHLMYHLLPALHESMPQSSCKYAERIQSYVIANMSSPAAERARQSSMASHFTVLIQPRCGRMRCFSVGKVRTEFHEPRRAPPNYAAKVNIQLWNAVKISPRPMVAVDGEGAETSGVLKFDKYLQDEFAKCAPSRANDASECLLESMLSMALFAKEHTHTPAAAIFNPQA